MNLSLLLKRGMRGIFSITPPYKLLFTDFSFVKHLQIKFSVIFQLACLRTAKNNLLSLLRGMPFFNYCQSFLFE